MGFPEMKLEGMVVGSNIRTNANNFPELKTGLLTLKVHSVPSRLDKMSIFWTDCSEAEKLQGLRETVEESKKGGKELKRSDH